MVDLWVTENELGEGANSPYALEACQTSSYILWALSGRKYDGYKTVTETYECPCRTIRPRDLWPASTFAYPALARGIITNVVSETLECGCPTSAHRRLRLRGRPVRSVLRVVSGGETVDPANYLLVNHSVLQAAPGGSLDPCGLEVTYTYGARPPVAGRRAARYLAEQFVKGWAGDDECELPDRVTSVSRQGVSITLLDNQDFLQDMRTGIYAVDIFLKAANPDHARKPARVYSPDLPRVTRRTRISSIVPGEKDLVISPGLPLHWELPLSTLELDDLFTESWELSGQISNAQGIPTFEFQSSWFGVEADKITLDMNGAQTETVTSGGVFEVYATSADGPTVIAVLVSNAIIN